MYGNKITTNSWFAPIDKLMLWRGSWSKYDHKASILILRVVFDQLIITGDTKILETINIHQKLKGIYKDDVLILIVCNSNNEIRKIKFQLKSNVPHCLEALGHYFPVVSHNNLQSNKVISCKYRSIDNVLKYAFERRDNTRAVNMPAEFESFVKLCLLDPCFPQMVTETENILNKQILKNQ